MDTRIKILQSDNHICNVGLDSKAVKYESMTLKIVLKH